MKVLIYSDVHGNLPAFEKMIKCEGFCDQYICLGDLVNYGPWSNECVELAMSLKHSVLLMGNHEEAFIQGVYDGHQLVKKFFELTIAGFNYFEEIKSFKADYKVGNYACIHTIENRYIYPDSIVELSNNYFIGHSHHQFHLTNHNCQLYNVGSVGQNRKKICIINYAIFDMDENSVNLKSLEYDASVVINEMNSRQYPEDCINYYRNKM